MEFVSNVPATVSAARGYIAGVLRVFSQQMTIWLFTAMVALLGALAAAAVSAPLHKEDALPLTVSVVVLLIFIVTVGAAHTFVRRGGPTPWGKRCSSSARLTFGYLAVLALLVWR